jgi:hypothetical protein
MQCTLAQRVAQHHQSAHHLVRIDEIGPHVPPDPIQPRRRFQTLLYALDHLRIVIRPQKRERQRQPSPLRCDAHQVKQEHQQIIRVPLDRRQITAMQDLEVDQPGATGGVVVDDICHRRIPV